MISLYYQIKKESNMDFKNVKIWIDTETGGLDPKKHSLLQLAAVAEDNGNIVDRFQTNIFHKDYCVTREALRVNKIDISKIEPSNTFECRDLATAIGSFIFFCKKYTQKDKNIQLCGQNTIFDINFIKEAMNQIGVNYDDHFTRRYVDLQSISLFMKDLKYIDVNSVSMDNLRRYFGITNPDSHTALADVEDTITIYYKYQDIIKRGGQ